MWTLLCSLVCFRPRGYDLLSQNTPENNTYSSQCDEKKPSCTNCSNHSIECDFSISPPTSASPSPPATSSSRRRYRFKQSKYQTLASPSPKEGDKGPESNSVAIQCDLSVSDSITGGISFADLQLFHHYLTSTYRTVVDESLDKNRVWSIHIPQWGISFPSILHLILALTALHLGHLRPNLRDQYVRQADDHFTFGVQSVTSVLSQLNSENCQRIYMSAVLICLVYFGHGPQPGEYLVFSNEGKAEWLILMRGVRAIVTHSREIFTGILAPDNDEGSQAISPELQGELLQHHNHLSELENLVERQTLGSDNDLYGNAVRSLGDIFDEVYNGRSAGKDGVTMLPHVIGWVYRLPEQFILLLENKDPLALIILAHWSILLRYMKSNWLFIGWDQHVVSGIRRSLAEEFQRWIEWPLQVIFV
ncbi:hypothetical protein BBP40_005168 [Aspergillus hancockii]|nr:hypothetical protein BBP40_005168 [Aspergillus hancockii]